MNEKDIIRELDEMLVMLKTLENKLISETSKTYVSISDICNIYAIQLAVLIAYQEPKEALAFIVRMYTEGAYAE
jgi:hypothetical protein